MNHRCPPSAARRSTMVHDARPVILGRRGMGSVAPRKGDAAREAKHKAGNRTGLRRHKPCRALPTW
eukprot:scaffold1827_cov421-Prasinococcus_capsulatus_cf.AAC.14